MKKKLAAQHDQFLTFLTGFSLLKENMIYDDLIQSGNEMGISETDTAIILDILVSDGCLRKRVKDYKGGKIIDYSCNPEMTKFIYDDGGYKKKRTFRNYEEGNIKFTYLRNWVWLLGFFLSLLLNIFLLIRIYLN